MNIEKRITDSHGQLIGEVPGLIQAGKYAEAAHFGALHGANYLAAEMQDGRSNDDAGFMPELYLYTGKTKLKLAAVVAVQTGGDDTAGKAVTQAIDTLLKFGKKRVTKQKPTAILAVIPGFATAKVKELRGMRVSKSKYRVSAAVGSIFTEPGAAAKAGALVAVGTAKELQRAGYNIPNGTKGIQFAALGAAA